MPDLCVGLSPGDTADMLYRCLSLYRCIAAVSPFDTAQLCVHVSRTIQQKIAVSVPFMVAIQRYDVSHEIVFWIP